MRLNYLCCFSVFILIFFTKFSDTSTAESEISDLMPVPPPLKVGWKTYFIETFTKANWFRASQFCRYQGMQLASIENREEQLALSQHLNKTGISDFLWTSGSNLAQNDTWVWFSNGNTAIYHDWDENQPNNYGGNEHCINIQASTYYIGEYKWNDANCTHDLYFICEKVKFSN